MKFDHPITAAQLRVLREAASKAQSIYAHALRAHKKQRRAEKQETKQ